MACQNWEPRALPRIVMAVALEKRYPGWNDHEITFITLVSFAGDHISTSLLLELTSDSVFPLPPSGGRLLRVCSGLLVVLSCILLGQYLMGTPPVCTRVSTPVAVKKAGMPAPPARRRSAKLPCNMWHRVSFEEKWIQQENVLNLYT